MDMNSAFPSKYLRACDVAAAPIKGRIESVYMDKVGDGEKPILMFMANGEEQKVVLNRINTDILIQAYGSESENWRGQLVKAYKDRTQFQGKMVDCIRLKTPPQQEQPPAPPQREPGWEPGQEIETDEPDDELGF